MPAPRRGLGTAASYPSRLYRWLARYSAARPSADRPRCSLAMTPPSAPPCSGLHGITPSPYSRAAGSTSSSTVRSARLYSDCSDTSPWKWRARASPAPARCASRRSCWTRRRSPCLGRRASPSPARSRPMASPGRRGASDRGRCGRSGVVATMHRTRAGCCARTASGRWASRTWSRRPWSPAPPCRGGRHRVRTTGRGSPRYALVRTPAVHVRRVEDVDAEFEGEVGDRHGLVLRRHRAEVHRAEHQSAHL